MRIQHGKAVGPLPPALRGRALPTGSLGFRQWIRGMPPGRTGHQVAGGGRPVPWSTEGGASASADTVPDREARAQGEPGLDTDAPFQMVPPVLQPPAGPQTPPPAAGTAGAQAEVAALAQRLLSSMRVGRVGRRGHEVRMRLGAGLEGVEVRLRHDDGGRLTAELHAEPWARDRARRVAERLSSELRIRGAELDSIELR